MMVATRELSWFSQLALRAMGTKGRERNVVRSSDRGSEEHLARWGDHTKEWPAFDLADAMEQGLARELVDSFAERAAPASEKLRELTVCRSGDRQEYVLLGEEEEPLLIARMREAERRIDIFVAAEAGVSSVALGPAFRLTYDQAKESWELRSMRCSSCEYRAPATRAPVGEEGCRTLFRLSQGEVAVGDGFTRSMELQLPREEEVWCSCCGGRRPGVPLSAPGPSFGEPVTLVNRKPEWSPRLRALTMPFEGRCKLASSKNFQLLADEARPGEATLVFGKMAPDAFSLDFRAPLGTVQAFGVALSTAFWALPDAAS